MSNHYLLVDDARRVYFDCEKTLIIGGEDTGQPNAITEQPFESWLRAVNGGDDPPEKTDRYRLAIPEGRALYEFLAASGWRVRIVSLDDDDYDSIYEPWAREHGQEGYKCMGTLGDG
jgi:hypothetical protein